MSTIIAGTDNSVSITRYARGIDISNLGSAYRVTWRKSGNPDFFTIDFDTEDKARAFYHLLYCSLDIE